MCVFLQMLISGSRRKHLQSVPLWLLLNPDCIIGQKNLGVCIVQNPVRFPIALRKQPHKWPIPNLYRLKISMVCREHHWSLLKTFWTLTLSSTNVSGLKTRNRCPLGPCRSGLHCQPRMKQHNNQDCGNVIEAMNSTTFLLDGTVTMTMMTTMTAMKTMLKNSQMMIQGFSFMRHLILYNCCLMLFSVKAWLLDPGLKKVFLCVHGIFTTSMNLDAGIIARLNFKGIGAIGSMTS